MGQTSSRPKMRKSTAFYEYVEENHTNTECLSEQNIALSDPLKTEVLGVKGWVVFGIASAALFIVTIIFAVNLFHVWRHVHSKYAASTGIVLSLYPIVALCMYLQIFFPRSSYILDSCTQLWLSVCMYMFFRLTMAYFGGETDFVQTLEGNVLPWRGVPCCFWPCVWPCLPKESVNKKQVFMLKLFILQHPIIEAVFSLIGFALYVEEQYELTNHIFPKKIYLYFYYIQNVSFLFALWAFIVSFKASREHLQKLKYGGKFFSFQLLVVFIKLQSAIFRFVLIPTGVIPCIPPVSPKVLENLILSSLVLGQLVILSVVANHFYKLSEADRKDFIK